MLDTFNIAKSIWDIAFDSIEISIKRNKSELDSGFGYIYYYEKKENKIYVWEYEVENKGDKAINKTNLNKIYENTPEDVTLVSIIENNSTFKNTNGKTELPIFEMKCNQDFPMEQTIIPIMKRKIMAYIFQIVNIGTTKKFDF